MGVDKKTTSALIIICQIHTREVFSNSPKIKYLKMKKKMLQQLLRLVQFVRSFVQIHEGDVKKTKR